MASTTRIDRGDHHGEQRSDSVAACPAWCTGSHGSPLLPDEEPGWRHLTAKCPPWCTGHPRYDTQLDEHASADATITLSGAPRIEEPVPLYGRPDSLAVRVWRLPHEQGGAPHVTVMHFADDSYLPAMTADEAEALAFALLEKAQQARQNASREADSALLMPSAAP